MVRVPARRRSPRLQACCFRSLATRFGAVPSAGSEGTGDRDPLTSPKKGIVRGFHKSQLDRGGQHADGQCRREGCGIGRARVREARAKKNGGSDAAVFGFADGWGQAAACLRRRPTKPRPPSASKNIGRAAGNGTSDMPHSV
jgi:hypothetical protein